MESEHTTYIEFSESSGLLEFPCKEEEKGHLNPWEKAKLIKNPFQRASVKPTDRLLSPCFQQASVISDDAVPSTPGKYSQMIHKSSKPKNLPPLSQTVQQLDANTTEKNERQADIVPVTKDPIRAVPVVKRVPTFGVPRSKVPKYSTFEESKDYIKKIPSFDLESYRKTSSGLVSASVGISVNSASKSVLKNNHSVSVKSTAGTQSTACESQNKVRVSSSNKTSGLNPTSAAPSGESPHASSVTKCNKMTILKSPVPQSKAAPARPSFGKRKIRQSLSVIKRARSSEELSKFESNEAVKTEKCNSIEIQKSKKVRFREVAQEKSHLPKTCKEPAGKNLTEVKEKGIGGVNEGSSKEVYPQKSQPYKKKSTKVVAASSLNDSYWDSLFRTVIADTYQEVESYVQKQEGQLTCHSKEDRDIISEDISSPDTTAACKQNWYVADSDLSSETIASSATEKAAPVDSGILEKVDSASQVSKFSLKVKVQDPSHCIQIKDIFEDKSRKPQTAPRKKRKPPKAPSSQKWKKKVGNISLCDELDSPKYDYEEQLIGGVGEHEVSPNTACIKEEVAKLIEEVDEILWVQCDDCKKWRKLDHTLDPSTLPEIWTCSMVPTVGENSCHIPEEHWNQISEVCTYKDYVMGSVVWARVPGTAWWPAMVDIDPDYKTYFWLNETLISPTSYHVTYFGEPVLRAWVIPKNMKSFNKRDTHKRFTFGLMKDQMRVSSLKAAVEDARNALSMDFDHRRKTFAFIFRFPGKLGKKRNRNSSHCSPQSDETKRKVACVNPKQKEQPSSQQSCFSNIIPEEKIGALSKEQVGRFHKTVGNGEEVSGKMGCLHNGTTGGPSRGMIPNQLKKEN